MSASHLVSRRYASALLDLAADSKAVEAVEKDFQDLDAMIQSSPDLQHLIASPLIQQSTLLTTVQALADKAKFQAVTKNFLSVLVENRRFSILSSIISAFGQELAKRRGEVKVDVTVAQDMSAKQKKDLEVALSKGLGRDVSVELQVKPDILGGMIVTVGSKMIDDSVLRKLERLKGALGVQDNENTHSNSNLSEVV